MKKVILFVIFLFLCSTFVLAQEKKCPVNSDSLYNRQTTLERIAKMLNDSVPEFKQLARWEFYVRNEEPMGFSIYDLTNPANTDSAKNEKCTNFVNNHIYHVYPGTYDFSFSHIVILENGDLKIFKSINCKDRGDSIEDVLAYLNLKLADDSDKIGIIERVKDYRKYGSYPRMDPMARVRCDQVK